MLTTRGMKLISRQDFTVLGNVTCPPRGRISLGYLRGAATQKFQFIQQILGNKSLRLNHLNIYPEKFDIRLESVIRFDTNITKKEMKEKYLSNNSLLIDVTISYSYKKKKNNNKNIKYNNTIKYIWT